MKKLLSVLFLLPALAHAEFETGNSLLADMRNPGTVNQMVALGYVKGVFDATQGVTHCTPNGTGITAGQIFDLSKQYLESIPHLRNRTADRLLSDLFEKTWPCPNRNRSQNKGV